MVTATPPVPAIYAALADVMADVTSVGKRDRNEAQNFSFRGVDAVTNAVGPALRKHRVVVIPELLSREVGTVEVGRGDSRRPIAHVVVQVAYQFYAPDGSSVAAIVPGEAMDSGDKAFSKAMSVAFRTALIQALALPTDEPDPDETTYERASAPAPQPPADPAALALAEAKGLVWDVWKAQHDGVGDALMFKAAYEQFASAPLDDAGTDELRSFRLHLASTKPEPEQAELPEAGADE